MKSKPDFDDTRKGDVLFKYEHPMWGEKEKPYIQ